MDKEILSDRVRYHLSGQEVEHLRSIGYGPFVMPRTSETRKGRILVIQNSAPSGKQSQCYLESTIKSAGFEVNTLPNSIFT